MLHYAAYIYIYIYLRRCAISEDMGIAPWFPVLPAIEQVKSTAT